ncbi:MAG: hypothetical protein DMG13_24685 [Acidobacteria bacterium]|nr:MAG: hypothetical protein DMG13_24685 [Acidobacteriota bacterium]
MKTSKRTILAAVFLGLSCFTSTGLAASPISCSTNIPAGTIIRVYPDEPIVAGTTSGPLLFTVGADVRFFPNRPPLLPRGSKILGKMESSTQAGRLWGRAKAKVVFASILTPDFCEYPIDSTLIRAGKHQVREEVIVGRGHARRDVFALLFPPTTLYQLIRLPARGPKLTINEEEQFAIKLLQPVYLAQSGSNETGGAASLGQPLGRQSSSTSPTARRFAPSECPVVAGSGVVLPIRYRQGITRPFQNTTPYEVVVYRDRIVLGTIAPCSESVLLVPRGGLTLKAMATIPRDHGQREVEATLDVNEKQTGWQVRLPLENSLAQPRN